MVDDGTLGKNGCQREFRRRLEKHIQMQKIHPSECRCACVCVCVCVRVKACVLVWRLCVWGSVRAFVFRSVDVYVCQVCLVCLRVCVCSRLREAGPGLCEDV